MLIQTLYDWPRLHYIRSAVFALTGRYYWNDIVEALARGKMGHVLGSGGIPSECRTSGIIFIHIPRCAGMSVSASLYGSIRDHHSAAYFRNVDPAFFAAAFKFAVMRNPIQRTISAYKYVLNKGAADMELDWGWQRKTKAIATFDDFLCFLDRRQERLHQLDYVLRPQSSFICDVDGTVLVDRLFRLERDLDVLNAMLRRWGLGEVPHINATPAVDVRLTDRQLHRIRALYEADIRLYAALDRHDGALEVAPSSCSRPPFPAPDG